MRVPSQLRTAILPLSQTVKPTWTASQVNVALRLLRSAEFSLASQLFDSMLEDDELPGTLAKRINGTLRADFRLELEGKTELPARAREAQSSFCEWAPDAELFDLIASWLVLGVGIATIDWDTTGPLWIPYLRTLPTEFLRYDETSQKWYYTTLSGEVEVTPGDGKWILLTHGQRSWIWGLIRGLARLWLGKGLAYCDWQRYNQKHGLPIVKAFTPIYRDESEKDKFIDDLSELQQEGVIGLPRDEDDKGYDVDLLEPTALSWESFQRTLERADRKMQVTLLGGNLGAEVTSQGANRAAATSHASELDRRLAKADAKALGYCLKWQLLKPYYAFNFGDGSLSQLPYPYWDTYPDEDALIWAQAQSTLATTLKTLREGGFEVQNLDQVARAFELKLKQVELPKPEPAVPPAKPKAKLGVSSETLEKLADVIEAAGE